MEDDLDMPLLNRFATTFSKHDREGPPIDLLRIPVPEFMKDVIERADDGFGDFRMEEFRHASR